MENFDDVITYYRNLSADQIYDMIDLFVISRNNKANHMTIGASQSVLRDENALLVFKQFEDKDIINKINMTKTY